MKTLLSILASASLLIQIGCGGSPTATSVVSASNPSGSSTPPTTQGSSQYQSWHFNAQSNDAPPRLLEALLAFSDSSITGVVRIALDTGVGTCINFEDVTPISGSVDTNNAVHLTALSDAGYGPTLTIDATLSADRSSMVSGKYQFTKSCGDGYGGTLTATKVNPADGHYVGTLSQGNVNIPATADLTQAKIPDVGSGSFNVSATLIMTGPKCAGTYNLGGSVIGNYIVFGSNLSTGFEALSGRIDPTGQQLTLSDYPYSDDCTAGYQGILQRQ